MKTVISVLIILFSVSSIAQQVRYNDGSYLNDDYIRDGNVMPNVPTPNDYHHHPPVVRMPNPRENEIPRQKPRPPGRKPAGGFYEVKESRGSVGTFREVGGGTHDQNDSLGSK